MKRILTISILLLAVIFTVNADRRRLLMARNVAAAGGGVDSPDDLSGLFAWYKSDALVTNVSDVTPPAADDTIRTWGDSSGNNRHLTTNNPTAAAPTFKSAAQTSKSQGGMQFASGKHIRVGFTAIADTTMFILWRNANAGSYKLILDSTNASARQVMYRRNTDLFAISSGTEQTVAGAIPDPSWNIFCAVFNSSGNDSVYTNGVMASTTLASGSQSLDGLTIGAAYDGTNPLGNSEYVGEVIIYDRNLNSTEIGQINTYLNTRWSVY